MKEIDLYYRANIRISKISNSAEYRMDKQLKNLKIFETNLDLLN